MKIDKMELEQEFYQFIDEIKDLLSPEIWQNILLDCSKNEVLILWLLYRHGKSNMSKIAEYIHVPLNTATGIIARMERKKLIIRERDIEDKRIVTIQLGEQGLAQMQALINELSYYGMQIVTAFTPQEMELFGNMMKKLIEIMKKGRHTEAPVRKIREISIE